MRHYKLLSKVSQIVLAAQGRPGSMFGIVIGDGVGGNVLLKMGEWNVLIERAYVLGTPVDAYGLIIQLEEGGGSRFLLIG